VHSRIERIHFAAAVAARAAANAPGGAHLTAVATDAARTALAVTFSTGDLSISVSPDSCSLGDTIDVTLRVLWPLPPIPFITSSLNIALEAHKTSICEFPGG
jgi:hypothetical protein